MMSSAGSNPDSPLYVTSPVIESGPLSSISGCNVYLKLENLQPGCSFKSRGISNFMKKAKDKGYKRMVISSGGNAGLAAAKCAQQLNIPITIYLAGSSAISTQKQLKALGAKLQLVGNCWDDANEEALKHKSDPECAYIHPFDDEDVWTGHSNIIHELKDQLHCIPDLIVVSVGGGGLLCGICEGTSAVGWDVPILAMESVGANCMNEALKAGKIISLPAITSLATCLGAKSLVPRAWEYTKTHPIISEVVTDKQLIEAITKFADDHRMLVESACGASLAAVYSDVITRLQQQPVGSNPIANKQLQNIVIIVCGGAGISLDILKKQQQATGICADNGL